MSILFTADTHAWHRHPEILRDRGFRGGKEMTEHLVDTWNSVVGKKDTVYHLGDVAMCSKRFAEAFLKQLNGKIHLIRGNHDSVVCKAGVVDRFASVQDVLALKIPRKDCPFAKRTGGNILIWLSHYGHLSWPASHWGSLHFFGHCVDEATELLTPRGWVQHQDVHEGLEVYSLHPDGVTLLHDRVVEVFRVRHTGPVYEFAGHGLSMRLTPAHRVFHYGAVGRRLQCEPACLFFRRNRVWLPRNGEYPSRGVLLSDDLLRLLICVNADCSLANSRLARFRVFKTRKLDYMTALLNRLGIEFRRHPQKDGSVSLDFSLPDALLGWKWKGLDDRLLACTKAQFSVLLEAYGNTDGSIRPKGWFIYTSKLRERDLLQHLATINGYTCSCYEKPAGVGFSTKPSWQLYLSQRQRTVHPNVSERVNETRSVDEPFWCVQTSTGNFIARRRGGVFITGNSHGKLIHSSPRAFDVGWDVWGRPMALNELLEVVEAREAASRLVTACMS